MSCKTTRQAEEVQLPTSAPLHFRIFSRLKNPSKRWELNIPDDDWDVEGDYEVEDDAIMDLILLGVTGGAFEFRLVCEIPKANKGNWVTLTPEELNDALPF